MRHGGEEVSARSARERNVGVVFQHYALFRDMTVEENVAFALRIRKRPRAEVSARVKELLELVQLAGFANRFPPSSLAGSGSAGSRSRAPPSRASCSSTSPSARSTHGSARSRRWLRRLHDELHVTSVFVTHDQEEAFEVSDRVVVMNGGRIEQVGSPRCSRSRRARSSCASSAR